MFKVSQLDEGGRQSKMAANSKLHILSPRQHILDPTGIHVVWEMAFSVKELNMRAKIGLNTCSRLQVSFQ